MKFPYTFRRLTPEEAPAMYRLIEARVAWMDERGIDAWNKNGYLDVYPPDYYAQCARDGQCFGLWTGDGRLAAAAVFREADDCWPDGAPALYVHNLVSDAACPGAGRALLSAAEDRARALGLPRLRLDAAAHNDALNAYYAALGFRPAGTCQDGGRYRGILREKSL